MKPLRYLSCVFACLLGGCLPAVAADATTAGAPYGTVLAISGTRFTLNGEPFPFTGISFFNAIYNPTFNQSSETRQQWLAKFQKYGINVLRIWCQWDNKRPFVDAGAGRTLYQPDGQLRPEQLATLKAIVADADAMGMVVLVALFSRESWVEGIRLSPEAMDRAAAAVTRELAPHRNVVLQVWNEFSERVLETTKMIRAVDPKRIVTNSPGYAGDLGDAVQNRALDYLSPHSSRQNAGRTWEIAPKEIAYLIARYGKPVVDDEPARNGTSKFGGPRGETSPYDHIMQIQQMWALGAYVIYHHDMFQTGYGTPACPPSGIPDPEHSSYHRQVFEFLALRDRYMPPGMYPKKP